MKRFFAWMLFLVLMLSAFACAENATAELQNMYAEAELLMAQGDYMGAASKFEALGTYSDASQMAMYSKAIAAAETLGRYDVAVMTFENLADFRDSKQMATYYDARGHEAAGDNADLETASIEELRIAVTEYEAAEESYTELALFKDCLTRFSDCRDKRTNVENRIEELQTEQADRKKEEKYQEAIELERNKNYPSAVIVYNILGEYKDSIERLAKCKREILPQIETTDKLLLPGGLYFGMTSAQAANLYSQNGLEYTLKDKTFGHGQIISCKPNFIAFSTDKELDEEVGYYGEDDGLYQWIIHYGDHGENDYDLIEEKLNELYGESYITNITECYLSGYISRSGEKKKDYSFRYDPNSPSKRLENYVYVYDWYGRYSVRCFQTQNGDVITIEHFQDATGHTMEIDELTEHNNTLYCNLYPADSVKDLSIAFFNNYRYLKPVSITG